MLANVSTLKAVIASGSPEYCPLQDNIITELHKLLWFLKQCPSSSMQNFIMWRGYHDIRGVQCYTTAALSTGSKLYSFTISVITADKLPDH
jgi:hypothetical protein